MILITVMCKIPTLVEAGWRYMGILCYFASFHKWKWSYFCCLVTKLCLTLSDPMDYSLTGSFVHGISQARILQWVAISFSRDLPDPGIKSTSPTLGGRFFTTKLPGKPKLGPYHLDYYNFVVSSETEKSEPSLFYFFRLFCYPGSFIIPCECYDQLANFCKEVRVLIGILLSLQINFLSCE